MIEVRSLKLTMDGKPSNTVYKPHQIKIMLDVCLEAFKDCEHGVLLTAKCLAKKDAKLTSSQTPQTSGEETRRIIHLTRHGDPDFDRELFMNLYGAEKLAIVDDLNGFTAREENKTFDEEMIVLKNRVETMRKPLLEQSSQEVDRNLKAKLWDLQDYLINLRGNPSKQILINKINQLLREL